MIAPVKPDAFGEEGMRARKRRQTHERIASAAIALFLERGFESTTIDDIARAADVSKRSFFDYFPTKEDVIGAWQDDFSTTLAASVAARPHDEALTTVVEEALTLAIQVSIHPQALALERLVRSTPSLQARDQLKYAKLEQVLADSLLARVDGDAGRRRARLLAAITIACMRVASDEWQSRRRTDDVSESSSYTREVFRAVWSELRELGAEAKRKTNREKAPRPTSGSRRKRRKT